MSPIPPDTLERLLLYGCEAGREPEQRQMRELMTKLAISRRAKADAKLVAQLKKGEACSWTHIHAIVRQRLDTWWHGWREDEEDEQHDETDGGGEEEKEVETEAEEEEEGSKALPGQSRDYTGPDFATFALTCPLPATFTFFSLSLHQRVVLLRCFCDDLLAFAADFASTVRGVEARDARIPPIGSDSHGHRYFFFGFPDWRIYREDNAKPIKPRELKADRIKRQQEEINRKKRGKAAKKKEEEAEEMDSSDEEQEQEDEEEEEKQHKSAGAKGAMKQNGAAKARGGKRAAEAESAPSTPTSAEDKDEDSATSRVRHASTAPAFQLVSSSPATLLALITAMRKSAYSKDKALSKQLQAVHDDLQQGKGRKDDDEAAEGEDDEAEGGEQTSKKRQRKEWGSGEVAKRSMRLMLVMAEKEEQERQQRMQAMERRKVVQQMKEDTIGQLAERYLKHHATNSKKRR